jgi:hypothetical protein
MSSAKIGVPSSFVYQPWWGSSESRKRRDGCGVHSVLITTRGRDDPPQRVDHARMNPRGGEAAAAGELILLVTA